MSTPLTPAQIQTIARYDAQQRLNYFIREVVTQKQIWILTDEHGSVMVNTDDEDCVPVWPNREFAEAWATNDWATYQAQAISLAKWHNSWTDGLTEDGIAIVVFPNQDEEGLVLFPDELDVELQQQAKKQTS